MIITISILQSSLLLNAKPKFDIEKILTKLDYVW